MGKTVILKPPRANITSKISCLERSHHLSVKLLRCKIKINLTLIKLFKLQLGTNLNTRTTHHTRQILLVRAFFVLEHFHKRRHHLARTSLSVCGRNPDDIWTRSSTLNSSHVPVIRQCLNWPYLLEWKLHEWRLDRSDVSRSYKYYHRIEKTSKFEPQTLKKPYEHFIYRQNEQKQLHFRRKAKYVMSPRKLDWPQKQHDHLLQNGQL